MYMTFPMCEYLEFTERVLILLSWDLALEV